MTDVGLTEKVRLVFHKKIQCEKAPSSTNRIHGPQSRPTGSLDSRVSERYIGLQHSDIQYSSGTNHGRLYAIIQTSMYKPRERDNSLGGLSDPARCAMSVNGQLTAVNQCCSVSRLRHRDAHCGRRRL